MRQLVRRETASCTERWSGVRAPDGSATNGPFCRAASARYPLPSDPAVELEAGPDSDVLAEPYEPADDDVPADGAEPAAELDPETDERVGVTREEAGAERTEPEGVEADGVETDGVLTEGVLADGVDTDGVVTVGVDPAGVVTDGVVTDGVVTDGTVADGVDTEGVLTEGTVADGVETEGVETDGVERPDWPSATPGLPLRTFTMKNRSATAAPMPNGRPSILTASLRLVASSPRIMR